MKTVILTLMLMTLLASAASANLITNGSLESWVPDGFDSSSSWYSYKVQPDTVALNYFKPYNTPFTDGTGSWLTGFAADGYGFTYCTSNLYAASDGSRFVRLRENISGGSGFYGGYATIPGTTYVLSLDMAGDCAWGPVVKSMNVQVTPSGGSTQNYYFDWDGTGKVGVVPQGGDPGWEQHSITFTATANTTWLGFWNNTFGDNGNGGALLDNLSLEAVPEPCSLLALGAGLIGLVARRRR